MIKNESDIHQRKVILDLEWVGNSHIPTLAHLTEVAARDVCTGDTFNCCVVPLALGKGQCTSSDAVSCTEALHNFIAWLQPENNDICLIAHNGIRFDIPVLLSNAARCNIVLPHNIVMLDSLYHLRHHMRHRGAPEKLDLDSLARSVDLDVDNTLRHTAMYDVGLLHDVLTKMSKKWDIPYISGLAHPLQLSTMLIPGIGPTVCLHLGVSSLFDMCTDIVAQHGDLSATSCAAYLKRYSTVNELPLVNVPLISSQTEAVAKRYLHYLASRD